jgi:hypothetical protein
MIPFLSTRAKYMHTMGLLNPFVYLHLILDGTVRLAT